MQEGGDACRRQPGGQASLVLAPERGIISKAVWIRDSYLRRMWFFFLFATLLSGYAHKSFLPFWNDSPILEGQLCTPPEHIWPFSRDSVLESPYFLKLIRSSQDTGQECLEEDLKKPKWATWGTVLATAMWLLLETRVITGCTKD